MACQLHWIPDSLYNYSISTVVQNYSNYLKIFHSFHGRIVFDVYYKLYSKGLLQLLGNELQNVDQFEKILKVYEKRTLLHNCFQALMDEGCDTATKLAGAFKKKCYSNLGSKDIKRVVSLGFELGTFLIEAGWYPQSETVYLSCLLLCTVNNRQDSSESLTDILECQKKLLHVWNTYCIFNEGKTVKEDIMKTIQKVQKLGFNINLATVYSEFASYHFIRGEDKEAYSWSVKAIKELNSSLAIVDIINVLRIAAKACSLRKKFTQAETLIKHAVKLAQDRFDPHQSLLVASVLMDYGYYLLHMDMTGHAIRVYQKALDIRNKIIGGTNNLLLATAHEDFAYASYVYEYNTGYFKEADLHVVKSVKIKEALLPENHFLFNSGRRVHALILEEIAVDSGVPSVRESYCAAAEELHLSALAITKQHLGEHNVLVGKHYGNIGRLYQSMQRFEEAEKMLLRSIQIKTSILGPDDYEVSICLGHLASLYSYDMEKFRPAMDLYTTAIRNSIDQLGPSYTGLEFDYKGLLRVYVILGKLDEAQQIQHDMQKWKKLREEAVERANNSSPLEIDSEVLKRPEDIYRQVFGEEQ